MGMESIPGVYDCNGRWALGRSYVYLFLARDSDGPMYVKVGRSDDPMKRIEGVQVGCPFRIIKASMVKCRSAKQARDIEARIHGRLAKFHSSGEWFRFDWTSPEQRKALADAFEGEVSCISDWKLEEIDPGSATRLRRAVDAEKQRRHRAKRQARQEAKPPARTTGRLSLKK